MDTIANQFSNVEVAGVHTYFQAAESTLYTPSMYDEEDSNPVAGISSFEQRVSRFKGEIQLHVPNGISYAVALSAEKKSTDGGLTNIGATLFDQFDAELGMPPEGATMISDIEIPPTFDGLFCESIEYNLYAYFVNTTWSAKDAVMAFFLPSEYCELSLYRPCPDDQACRIIDGGLLCEESATVEMPVVTPSSCGEPHPDLVQSPARENGIRWMGTNSFIQADKSTLQEVNAESGIASGPKIGLDNANGATTSVKSVELDEKVFNIANWKQGRSSFQLSVESSTLESIPATESQPGGFTVTNLHLIKDGVRHSLFTAEESLDYTTAINVPAGKDGFFCSQLTYELLSEDKSSVYSWGLQNAIIATDLPDGYSPCELALHDPCPRGTCTINHQFDQDLDFQGQISCRGLGGDAPPPVTVPCTDIKKEAIVRTETLQIQTERTYFKGDNVRVNRGTESLFVGARTIEDSLQSREDELKGMGMEFSFSRGFEGETDSFTWYLSKARYEDALLYLPVSGITAPAGFNAFHCDQINLDYGLSSTGEAISLHAEDVTLAAILPFGYDPCTSLKVFNPCRGEGKLCRINNDKVSCFGDAPAQPRDSSANMVCKAISNDIFARPFEPALGVTNTSGSSYVGAYYMLLFSCLSLLVMW